MFQRILKIMGVLFFFISEFGWTQKRAEDTPYIDFGQFYILKSEEKMDILDKLKLAAMELISAPALDKLVQLYIYNIPMSQEENNCEQASIYHNIHGLLVVQGLSANAVAEFFNNTNNEKLKTEVKSLTSGVSWVELSKFNDFLANNKKDIQSNKLDLSKLNNLRENSKLIWEEIRLSGGDCYSDLISIFRKRQTNTFYWKPVDNKGLFLLKKALKASSSFSKKPPASFYTLITDKPMPNLQLAKEFYADCDIRMNDNQTLCAKNQLH